MFKQNKFQAPKRDRDGLTSYILLQQGDISTDNLAVTWVDVAPGCSQRPHSHAPEQVYIIISGNGRIIIGDEEQDVVKGDLVHIPSNVVHSLVNDSSEVLTYISAATPAFDLQALYDTGKLRASRSST
ncbi:cupin domain-containing protein [Chroococcidiopsis sp. CCALA 051]|uniref:cupin domain-containing protein n=1 Tax=Chroococcidiopsis sp. CCALA 051 TaxID=869949 RepID=UPI001304AAFF|nr:cupin domain-containing protein [Chroococcidiopsis sp. CCALA 051]